MSKKFEIFSNEIKPGDTVVEINDFGRYDKCELSAGGLVFFRDIEEIKLLLLTRQDAKLTLPKGHVENGEDLIATALREVTEETGLLHKNLSTITELGWYPNPILTPTGKKYFKMIFYFLIEYRDRELPKLQVTEHLSANWYSLNDVSTLNFAYSHIYHVCLNGIGLINHIAE